MSLIKDFGRYTCAERKNYLPESTLVSVCASSLLLASSLHSIKGPTLPEQDGAVCTRPFDVPPEHLPSIM